MTARPRRCNHDSAIQHAVVVRLRDLCRCHSLRAVSGRCRTDFHIGWFGAFLPALYHRAPSLLWRGHILAGAAHAHMASAVRDDRRGSQSRTCAPFLAIVPAAWYCALCLLFRSLSSGAVGPQSALHYLLKATAVAGTFLACWVLVASAGYRRFVLIVPLGVAIVCGTVSIVFASP